MACALVLVGSLSGCGGKSTGSSTGTSGGASATASSTATTNAQPTVTPWLAVTLADGTVFFGQPRNDAPSGTLYLDDVYFLAQKGAAADTNTLRRFGSEIHKPYSAVVLPLTSVLYEQPLLSSSPVIKAVASFEAKSKMGAAPAVGSSDKQFYAVFLKDSQVVFGTLDMTPSSSVTVKNAHYLSFKSQQAAKLGEIKSLNDVTLVPERQAAIAPSGDVIAPLTSVLYFQPLQADSPVVKAISGK